MRYLIPVFLILFSFGSQADSKMDLSFMFGPSLSQSGNIDKLGDPNMNMIFDFNYYFKDMHGMGVSIGNEYDFDGKDKLRSLNDASLHTFEIHYTFRYRAPNSKFKFTFSPGFGWQTLYDKSNDYYWGYSYYDDLSTAWILNYKLLFDYVFFEDGTTNFFAGIGFTQIMSLDDSLYGQDISGTRLSGLARIGVGF